MAKAKIETKTSIKVNYKLKIQEKILKVKIKKWLLLVKAFKRTLASLLLASLINKEFWQELCWE